MLHVISFWYSVLSVFCVLYSVTHNVLFRFARCTRSVSIGLISFLLFPFLISSKLAALSCGCKFTPLKWYFCICSATCVLCPFGGVPSKILYWGWCIGQRLYKWEWGQSGVPAPSSDQGQCEGCDVLLLNPSALPVAWILLDDYTHS